MFGMKAWPGRTGNLWPGRGLEMPCAAVSCLGLELAPDGLLAVSAAMPGSVQPKLSASSNGRACVSGHCCPAQPTWPRVANLSGRLEHCVQPHRWRASALRPRAEGLRGSLELAAGCWASEELRPGQGRGGSSSAGLLAQVVSRRQRVNPAPPF